MTFRMSSSALRAEKIHPVPSERPANGNVVSSSVPSFPLSPSIAFPAGIDTLPVVGSFAFQSDGRPLHNIQIDPSNPMNIHAIITDPTDPSAADTAQLLTRRCFYTFSSDGGATWTTPVLLSSVDGGVRTGYADMQLFKRNDKYVPIIAAHKVTAKGAASLEVVLWIEKGNPGDGHFSESIAPRITGDGANADIAWPTLAMSPTGDTAYVLATVNPPTAGAYDQLQFGRFILNTAKDSAVFDGTQWIAPGDAVANNPNVNNPTAGLANAGGEARIRVSPSGKIGILWVNADYVTPDLGLYFSESTDGGNTWPNTLTPVWNSFNQTADNNGAQLAPISGDVDFWYDGENPKFLFLLAAQILSTGGTLPQGTYYPSTATLAFWDPTYAAPGTGQIVPIVSPYLTTPQPQDPAAFEQALPVGTSIQSGGPMIEWATVARTPDTNQFAVFYQTYAEGDTELINTPSDPTLDSSFAYGSIYYQETTDGGQTWSAATPLLSASATTPELDYRQPMTSDFNDTSASGPQYKVVAVVDTAPGNLYRNGIYGFDLHNFALASVGGVDAVSPQQASPIDFSLSAFPNPMASAASIGFTLPSESAVLLTVSDMLGRTVETLASGRMGPGEHTVIFNGADLPNGVYRYTLRVNGESITRSMSLLR